MAPQCSLKMLDLLLFLFSNKLLSKSDLLIIATSTYHPKISNYLLHDESLDSDS